MRWARSVTTLASLLQELLLLARVVIFFIVAILACILIITCVCQQFLAVTVSRSHDLAFLILLISCIVRRLLRVFFKLKAISIWCILLLRLLIDCTFSNILSTIRSLAFLFKLVLLVRLYLLRDVTCGVRVGIALLSWIVHLLLRLSVSTFYLFIVYLSNK